MFKGISQEDNKLEEKTKLIEDGQATDSSVKGLPNAGSDELDVYVKPDPQKIPVDELLLMDIVHSWVC